MFTQNHKGIQVLNQYQHINIAIINIYYTEKARKWSENEKYINGKLQQNQLQTMWKIKVHGQHLSQTLISLFFMGMNGLI